MHLPALKELSYDYKHIINALLNQLCVPFHVDSEGENK